jgi:hypothetical protein
VFVDKLTPKSMVMVIDSSSSSIESTRGIDIAAAAAAASAAASAELEVFEQRTITPHLALSNSENGWRSKPGVRWAKRAEVVCGH